MQSQINVFKSTLFLSPSLSLISFFCVTSTGSNSFSYAGTRVSAASAASAAHSCPEKSDTICIVTFETAHFTLNLALRAEGRSSVPKRLECKVLSK